MNKLKTLRFHNMKKKVRANLKYSLAESPFPEFIVSVSGSTK